MKILYPLLLTLVGCGAMQRAPIWSQQSYLLRNMYTGVADTVHYHQPESLEPFWFAIHQVRNSFVKIIVVDNNNNKFPDTGDDVIIARTKFDHWQPRLNIDELTFAVIDVGCNGLDSTDVVYFQDDGLIKIGPYQNFPRMEQQGIIEELRSLHRDMLQTR